MHYKCSLLFSLPHSALCSPAMQIVPHLLLLLVGIVEIAEFSLVNTNKKADFNMVNTNKKAELNFVNTNKKATESLTSKCNLKLVKLGLTRTEARQILCQILWNMKVLQKGARVVIKKPSFFKLFPENAENRKPNNKSTDKYWSFKLNRVM